MTECVRCASSNASDPVIVESLEQLTKHISEHHTEKIFEEDENNQENNKHQCSKCCETFSNLVDLGMHLNNVHGRINAQYQCPSCIKTHPSSTKLRIHIENVHLKRKTKCPLCKRQVTYHGLRNHIRVLHGGKEFWKFLDHTQKIIERP